MISLNFSKLLRARPPDTTRPADARSGREDTVSSSLMCLVGTMLYQLGPRRDANARSVSTALISSTVALPEPTDALSNAVVRTVTTLIASLDFTFMIALPA